MEAVMVDSVTLITCRCDTCDATITMCPAFTDPGRRNDSVSEIANSYDWEIIYDYDTKEYPYAWCPECSREYKEAKIKAMKSMEFVVKEFESKISKGSIYSARMKGDMINVVDRMATESSKRIMQSIDKNDNKE